MSRLYDRVLAEGCRPVTAGMLYGQAADDAEIRKSFEEDLVAGGVEPTPEAMDALIRDALARASAAKADTVFDAAQLFDAIVIAADEVGEYFARLPLGTDVRDIVSVLSPPFDRFFVEFRTAPNPVGLVSWGVLFETIHSPSAPQPSGPEDEWLLLGTMVGEWRKGQPVGPIMTWLVPLDAEGHLSPGDDGGHGSMFGTLVGIEGMLEQHRRAWGNHFISTLGPALLTISLMHCKNVDVNPVEPPRSSPVEPSGSMDGR